MADTVGPMMNRLMNRARPAITWLGGMLVSPSALRVMPSTTKILVKQVQSSSRAGATDSSVSAIRTTIELLGLPPTMSTLTVPGFAGALGATGGLGGAGAAGRAT